MQSLYYPPEVGGLESHVQGLAEGLARHSHAVDLLTSRSRPDLPAEERVAGVRVHRVWMPGRNPVGWAAHVAATSPAHLRLARHAEIVHVHTFACVPPTALARRLYGRPVVLTLHTSHFLVRATQPLWRPLLRWTVRAADYLLATSQEILEVARSLYPHRRAEMVTNAVDTERFRPAAHAGGRDGRWRIVVPRRLFPKNGVEHFVRAMPAILAEVDVEARIIGDGPERARLEALARELRVADAIRFLGARPNREMPSLLGSADIAVIPSLMEATSVAALEAMSCGLPVAASRVGGLPEIIDGSVGTLFRPADPDDLARAVTGLLNRPDLRDLGRAARQRVVANWSIDRLVARHLEIYRELLG